MNCLKCDSCIETVLRSGRNDCLVCDFSWTSENSKTDLRFNLRMWYWADDISSNILSGSWKVVPDGCLGVFGWDDE